ncbi:MAG TPA: alpha/beta hydrolase [Verrucomicrobiae bacterium]|nr:alpha/beta hydrolase [Verrucomicrobiae bacterium]
MKDFSRRYGNSITVNSTTWHYCRLGSGTPLFLLPGGLRRISFGFALLERLATRHVVIAPDFPPVQTIHEFFAAFDAILQAEGITNFALGGQSYGGLLAQAYLAYRTQGVERLVLSSTGPANYGKVWLVADYAAIGLVRLIPERIIKKLLVGGLLKAVPLPEPVRAEWTEALHQVVDHDLSRADIVSHFAVAADLIRRNPVNPAAYRNWTGRIIVLKADNDPSQSPKDFPRYEKLFGRPVEVIDMGNMSHIAPILYPDKYAELYEQALV